MKSRSLLRPIAVGILLGIVGPIRPLGIGGGTPAVDEALSGRAALASERSDEDGSPGQMPDEFVLRVLSQAEGLLRLGSPEAAAALAGRLPTTGPHGLAVLRVRAWALLESGGFEELADLLSDHDPLAGELQFLRGVGRVRSGDIERGGRDLQQLWWDEPEGTWGLAAVRELAEVKGVYSRDEQKILKRHLRRATTASAGHLRGVTTTGQLLDALIRTAPARTRLAAELHRAKGMRLTRAEDFSAAAATLSAAKGLTRDPGLRRAIELQLGEAERRRGRLRSAARWFDAVAATSDDALALDALARAGQMFIEYRRYQEARRRFESQLVTNPVGPGRQQALWGLGWVAFRTGNYDAARRFFVTLRDEEPYGAKAPGAIYWAARALEELGGEPTLFRSELAALVERFPIDYYAFRATAHLGPRPWASAFGALPPEQPTAAGKHLAGLMELGMEARARKELRRILEHGYQTMGPQTLTTMAEAAAELGSPQQALRFIYRRDRRFPDGTAATIGPLGRQFPQEVVALVTKEAKKQGVSPELVVALVRQESGFQSRATSPVGALGLMQLMPATATELLRENNRRARPTTAQILEPKLNVRLGVRYLGRMLRAFRNRTELALAAYNAGPGAVTRWRQARGDLPADIFVEEIPYSETNTYVRKILAWRQAIRMMEESKRNPGQRTVLATRER